MKPVRSPVIGIGPSWVARLEHQKKQQAGNNPMTKFHENYSREGTIARGSERSFGIVMTVAFAVISLVKWWHDGRSWGWTGGIAVFFLAAALIYPRALQPFNQLWFKFGLLLHRVVN